MEYLKIFSLFALLLVSCQKEVMYHECKTCRETSMQHGKLLLIRTFEACDYELYELDGSWKRENLFRYEINCE